MSTQSLNYEISPQLYGITHEQVAYLDQEATERE
jgi:hypothetical protein